MFYTKIKPKFCFVLKFFLESFCFYLTENAERTRRRRRQWVRKLVFRTPPPVRFPMSSIPPMPRRLTLHTLRCHKVVMVVFREDEWGGFEFVVVVLNVLLLVSFRLSILGDFNLKWLKTYKQWVVVKTFKSLLFSNVSCLCKALE